VRKDRLVKGIIYFIIATVGLLFGAVQPWIMALYAVLMILAFVVLLWQGELLWRPGVWAWVTGKLSIRVFSKRCNPQT
jgi:ABC-type xylose transport system permease subunit